MKKIIILTLLIVLSVASKGFAGDISKPHTWVDGETPTAALWNANEDAVITEVNDLDGDNLASDIAITTSGTGTFSGTLSATGTFKLGGSTVTSSAAELNIMDGVTSSAAELNVLDGIAPTVTELNYVDGVTSAIQTQFSNLLNGTTAFTAIDIDGGNIAAFTLSGKLTAGASEIEGSAFDINGGTIDGITSLTAGGNLDIGAYELRAQTLEADVSTGTAPLTISSTTHVANLNVDQLDNTTTNTTFDGDVIYISDASGFIPGQFGAWATNSTNTTYTAATDGFVLAYSSSNADTGNMTIFSDGSSPPTTVRAICYDTPSTAHQFSAISPVRKGDYWKVTVNTWTATVLWLPTGN